MILTRDVSPGEQSKHKATQNEKGMVSLHESKTFREKDLRKVQNYQEKRSYHGNLRKSEAQAEAGLMPLLHVNESER